jgi:peroxiredoxin
VAERPALLKVGTAAPEFRAEAWGGGTCQLSDFRGRVVVLDFWATWCGPCQRSMPHIEKVWQAVKNKNVVVLGVCVWDEKAAYEKWIPENKSKYTFSFAFDPAGRDSAKSIAGKLFQVSGIPTTYIIDKDGKVADAIVGYQDGDKRVEEALKKLGVEAATELK